MKGRHHYGRSRCKRIILPRANHAEALASANGPVKVLVSEPHQKTNVEKLARDRGKKTSVTEDGTDFVIIIE